MSASDVVESAREQLDRKIRQHIEDLSDLRAQRNSLATVSRLPPELLSRIFHFCSTREPLSVTIDPLCGINWSAGLSPLTFSWVKVAYVCRLWRDVALDCASLWNQIDFNNPKWTREMLKRSKHSSIVVKVDLTYRTPSVASTVQLALEHVHRIRELDLAAPHQTLQKLEGFLACPAPLLETLRLSNARLGSRMDTVYRLPDSLFAGEAPRLRRLELGNCEFSWDSPFLAHLTHLHIDAAGSYDDSSRPTMTQFRTVLQKMPDLVSLHLKSSLPRRLEGSNEVSPPLNLPQLRQVFIQDSVENCGNALKQLTLHKDVKLKLECRSPAESEEDVLNVLSLVEAYRLADDEGDKRIRTLSITVEYGSIRLIGDVVDNAAIDITSDEPVVPIDLSLWVGFSHGSATAVILAAACRSLCVQHIKSLRVRSTERLPTINWSETFGELSELETLHIGGTCSSHLVVSLVELDSQEGEQGGGSSEGGTGGHLDVYLPALRSISMDDVTFSQELISRPGVEVYSAFHEWLANRSERGAAVEEVKLANCSSVSDRVDELREIVPTVTWDGVDRHYSDSSDGDCECSPFDPFGDSEWSDGMYDDDYGFDAIDAMYDFAF